MRETTLDFKNNFNITRNYHETIRRIFGIDHILVEQALESIKENINREQKNQFRQEFAMGESE